MPRRAATPGRKVSKATSAQRARRRTTALLSSCLRSSAILRLLRLATRNKASGMWRAKSPPGGSTLMMSAPRSPRMEVANGPGSNTEKSRTRTPTSGCQAGGFEVKAIACLVALALDHAQGVVSQHHIAILLEDL